MSRTLCLAALTALLGACGVDGPPIPPNEVEEREPGITFSGQVQMGVVGGSGMSTRPATRIKGNASVSN